MASNPLGLEVGWRGGVMGGNMGLTPQDSPAQSRIILIKKNTLGVVQKRHTIKAKLIQEGNFFLQKECATGEVGEQKTPPPPL